jgi:DNA-directed RNA polymerase subunit beta'
MLFKDNIWYPKDGSLTVVVRHEIQYGIWEALIRESNGKDSGCKSREEAYNAVCDGSVEIESSCMGTTAGHAAFDYCICGNSGEPKYDFNSLFKKGDDGQPGELNAKALSKMLYNEMGGTDGFLRAINKLVKLGFAVSRYYPPAIGVITNSTINAYVDRRISEFNREMVDHKKFVDLGMETEERYSMYFSDKYSELEKELKKYIRNNLPKDNGYWRMVVSGSKGDDSNLLQIYGIKGRVQKSDLEAFNTTIDGSYSRQLTGLEHFVTAYGSRKGISDKVLSTAKPGYMSRKLEHAGAPLRITSHDCSSYDGDVPALEFYPQDIIPFIEGRLLSPKGIKPSPEDDAEAFHDNETVSLQLTGAISYLAKILVGRYVVDDNNNSIFISNESQASSYIRKCWSNIECDEHYLKGTGGNAYTTPVRMRSPITCKNPCCQMCYGKDWSKNTNAPYVGRNVGFIAAQAIGEPGTQMTMKNFQKGGVVGDANLTSSFDLIEANFDLKDFTKGKYDNGIVKYDPVSPVSGFVKKVNMGGNKSMVIITETSHVTDTTNLLKQAIYVDNRARLKNYVYRGDTLFFELGNVAVRDIIRYRSFEDGYKYLLLNLYNIFTSVSVKSVHFECIIRNMICYQIVANDTGSKFRAGDIITYRDLAYIDSPMVMSKLIGVKYLPKYKPDFLQSIAMESCTTYVPRAIVNANTDSMTDPIMRTAFGLSIHK